MPANILNALTAHILLAHEIMGMHILLPCLDNPGFSMEKSMGKCDLSVGGDHAWDKMRFQDLVKVQG